MARKVISLEVKTTKAKANVVATKEMHDAALDELAKLVTKCKKMEERRLLKLTIPANNLPMKSLHSYIKRSNNPVRVKIEKTEKSEVFRK